MEMWQCRRGTAAFAQFVRFVEQAEAVVSLSHIYFIRSHMKKIKMDYLTSTDGHRIFEQHQRRWKKKNLRQTKNVENICENMRYKTIECGMSSN